MKKVLRGIERFAHWFALLLGIVAIAAVSVIIGRPSEKSGNQPNFVGAEQQQKRLAVFLYGTWNSVNSNTNVWRMRALCAAKSKGGKPQLVYYEVGVNGFMGGVFGQGLDENIRLAYEWLIENYNDGDEIFIFGFSRGAFTARSLAGLIALNGILRAGSPIGVTELFDRYKKGNEESIWVLKEMEASKDTSNDEHRNDFAPTLWDVRHPKDPNAVIAQPRPLSSVEQRWFVGAHANVGGGYQTDLLAQAPLRWMMKKAESHGLSFRSEVDLDGEALKAPITDSYRSFGYGLYAVVSSPLYRTIGREPDVRDDGSHINVNETIDATVFQRWRADPTYRPANLVEWAQRKKVDPAQLQTSVRANDPGVDVPDQ